MKRKKKPTVVSILKFKNISTELKEAKRKLKTRSLKVKDIIKKHTQQLQEPSFQWDF